MRKIFVLIGLIDATLIALFLSNLLSLSVLIIGSSVNGMVAALLLIYNLVTSKSLKASKHDVI